MSWTDETGNPECECGHLWSNHYQKVGMYFCEAPECECQMFSEHGPLDEWAKEVFLMEEGGDYERTKSSNQLQILQTSV